jgi:Leucine-rich repeat (LRR) protein
LSDNLFTGSIPSGLSSLGKLTTLALDLNEFQGSVDTMGRMTNLQYLYLDSNQFTGRLDQGIFDHLQNLTELTLADNSFEASRFPSAFLSFPKLRNLDLSVNAISGSLPPTIPMNTMLEYLTLSDNNIGGSIPSAIRALVALRQLDLSLNYLSGSIPYSLNGLTNLQYFYLDQNKFKAGPFPQLFGSMTQLNELSLADTGLTGTIPYWIKSLKLLESFDVRKNSLDGVIPSSIWEMTKLQYLLLSTNFLHGTFPAYVPLTNLQIAALHENALTGNASGFCKNNIPILTYDCHKVTCDCCSKELGCCLQGLNGSCYESVKWVQDLGVLEHNYTLTALGF